MKKRLIHLLRLLDFKEEEICLYLLLLKVGKATIPELIVKSRLKSITVYRTIKRLLDRELIHMIALNGKQHLYFPLTLKSLLQRVHAEQRKLERMAKALRGLDPFLPFLDFNESNRDRDEDEMIEVKEGIDAFRAEYLKMPGLCSEEYLHIGSMQNYWKVANMTYDCAEERNFIHQRLQKGVFARVFNSPSPQMDEVIQRDSLEKRTTRVKQNLPVTQNYFGMADKHSSLFLCDAENPRVIVVRQPELLQIQKEQFRSMWKQKD